MKRWWIVLGVLGLTGILAAGAYAAVIWYVYVKDAGWSRTVQDDAYRQNLRFTATKVADQIYMLQDEGGNVTALIGDNGILLVDCSEDWAAPKLYEALRELSDQPVRYVIDTHSHGDHRGGNGFFRDRGAEIVGHTNLLEAIKNDGYARAEPNDLPTIMYEQQHRFFFEGQTVELTHYPMAHTNNDTVVRFVEAKVVASGDVFVNKALPFLSVRGGTTIDGFLQQQQAFIESLTPEDVVIPGHGPLGDRAAVIATHERLTEIRDRVAFAKGLGLSARQTRFLYPTWPWPSDWRTQNTGVSDFHFLYLVYDSLPD